MHWAVHDKHRSPRAQYYEQFWGHMSGMETGLDSSLSYLDAQVKATEPVV
jgi:hypothetical protein